MSGWIGTGRWSPRANENTILRSRGTVRLDSSPAAADHREVCTISKYQEFDAQIFDVTKIMIGFSLTDAQKTELLKIAGEIEAACQDGSLSADERQRLLETMADCGLELPQTPMEPCVNEAKLQERLTQYMELDLFQMDIGALINDYKSQGLPMPTMEQLQAEVIAEARKCLETIMICEAKGHLWKETADPENGTSTLSCRRCGAEEHLRW